METFTHCVKCGAEKTAAKECPACGVIYAKAEQAYVPPPPPPPPVQEPPNPNLVACAICGKDISVNAQACPHCGEPIIQPPPPTKPKEVKPASFLTTIFWSCVIGSLLVIFGNTDPGSGTNKTEKPTTDLSTTAVVQCRNFVTQQLKSPATADFPLLDHKIWQLKDRTYVVKSYVDSQNSYGATIRSSWHCKVQYVSGDRLDQSNWKLLDLEIL